MVTVAVIEEQQANYKAQYEQLQAGLARLEQEYASNKELLVATMNQVSGAIQALEVLRPMSQVAAEPLAVETDEEKAERVAHAIAP